MSPLPTAEGSTGTDVVPLPRSSRRVRLAVTAVLFALVMTGTVWGDDADFPFGPFRMYSTRADPDAAVVSTRVVGLTESGQEVRLSGGEVGLRRAEFEGQLPRMQDEPDLLALLAATYAERHPAADPLVEIRVVQRRFELVDGQRTGEYTDTVVVDHDVAGTDPGGAP
ncbi:hypothetical protein [Trujillonella humicola]|uniref:hypothetical protein n=1 Tax=Trujillonella humicola TaxID=3383699 RepID=UPI00390667FD